MNSTNHQQLQSTQSLLGNTEGWPLASLLVWLITDGRKLNDRCKLLRALSNQLLAAGLPIIRIRFTLHTIHPEITGKAFTWWRGREQIDVFTPEHGIEVTNSYRGSPIEKVRQTNQMVRYKLSEIDISDAHIVLQELAATQVSDYIVFPLEFTDGYINTFTIATDHPSGFTDQDIQKLSLLLDYLTPILEVYTTRDIIRSLLNTYVGPKTGQKILKGSIKRGDSEIIEAALWYSDLRNFTALTESLENEHMLELINAYFEIITNAVTHRGGEVLRFIGDAMLILFTKETASTINAACEAALDAAILAYEQIQTLNAELVKKGQPIIEFGVGLHQGEVIYGNVGSSSRLDFTVMGPAVNRTARIEELTQMVGTNLLMSDEFASLINHPVHFVGKYPVKGVAEPLAVYRLEQSTADFTINHLEVAL
ncbi:adenylate/guanylate cyclase domain-containing protein [Spartinivicinus poritis]|uniref:Adenylate/guanylate cyclase domain-containing protein n=1 Tax=Spartinivicinus poritis TaxID=2994640 RepID=A0ABT5UAQ7_9GAMM|nr:adenylate/guanylate cyclase domain-containing protein [Spartinivicinus sp. A2-2]MDE1463443.1 adenylate/guanylate cyclase domain-containing protein [Spartinivicinus sp. A2-2]